MFSTTCPRCSGGDETCDRCGGGGEATYKRCPASMVDPDVRELMRAYKLLKDGLTPVAGGSVDQSRCFMRWVGVIDGERSVIEEEREAARRRKAQR